MSLVVTGSAPIRARRLIQPAVLAASSSLPCSPPHPACRAARRFKVRSPARRDLRPKLDGPNLGADAGGTTIGALDMAMQPPDV
jgi:hypothetical protein